MVTSPRVIATTNTKKRNSKQSEGYYDHLYTKSHGGVGAAVARDNDKAEYAAADYDEETTSFNGNSTPSGLFSPPRTVLSSLRRLLLWIKTRNRSQSKHKLPLSCRSLCCSLLLLVLLILYLFHPNVNGCALLYIRTNLPFLQPENTVGDDTDDTNTHNHKTCVVQAYDARAREKYQSFVQRNKKWAEQVMGYTYYEYMQHDHEARMNAEKTEAMISEGSSDSSSSSSYTAHYYLPWKLNFWSTPVHQKEAPHYLKFHAMQYLFSEPHNCDYVLYIDSDAVVTSTQHKLSVPRVPGVDILFGNEVFVAAIQQMKKNTNNNKKDHRTTQLPFNSGFLLVQKSDFSNQFIRDVLTHPRCDPCRYEPCTIFGFYDQGCMEKLLRHEYKHQKHHFGVANVQSTEMNPDMLLCHLAGLNKQAKKHGCQEEEKQKS